MTPRTFDAVKENAADHWAREHGEQEPMDAWADWCRAGGRSAFLTWWCAWLGRQGIPAGSVGETLGLNSACTARSRGLKAARLMLERGPDFELGQEG